MLRVVLVFLSTVSWKTLKMHTKSYKTVFKAEAYCIEKPEEYPAEGYPERYLACEVIVFMLGLGGAYAHTLFHTMGV